MKKNFIPIIVLLALVLIVASGQMGCKKEEGPKFNSSALNMNFVKDAPPSELVTGSKYPIYTDIKNTGGYDIPEGAAHFYLSGIADNLKNVETSLQNVNFLNKKTEMQEGGQERLIFATEAEPWKTLPSSFDLPIQLTSCYKYATIMQTSVCVGKGDLICNIDGDKIQTKSNSNGPIQITSLTENISGNTLYVKFTIENKGNGEVYLPTADCDLIQSNDVNEKLKKDQVELAIKADGFTCKLQNTEPPFGTIDSLEGLAYLGQVVCQRALPQETHLAPFEIVASYKYKETIMKTLKILPA